MYRSPMTPAAPEKPGARLGPSRLTVYVARFWAWLCIDGLVGLGLFLLGCYAYITSLAPTVLEGDAALFQYTPYVLGVTYPTGYPLYILLGKVWVTLFPFGELAWRMNLLSALCSAAALPLIYGAARRLFGLANSGRDPWISRWAALAAVVIFATLPTFWRWSTETKIYALNILLFSGVLYTLVRAAAGTPADLPAGVKSASPRPGLWFPLSAALVLPAFLTGLQLSVHSTTVLLLPGLLLFAWLYMRPYLLKRRLALWLLVALALPGLLYFYIPLRAEWLIGRYGYSEAIMRGLLADFYHSGWTGWVRYFSAADFTGGVVTNWSLVPQQFLTVYVPLLLDDFSRLGVALGLAGGIGLALFRPRLFWPLFLLYAAPVPFVLAYGQGEQSAFLLPSFLIFSIFAGSTFFFFGRLLASRAPQAAHILLPLLFLALFPLLFLPQARYNLNWLDAKWTRAIYDEWADALAHPLPERAAVLAHWGDLTSFWYMQYGEGRRPDLRGLYPPTEETVTAYLKNGGDLFIAGPLQGWAAGIEDRYQLLPWGRLVRIALRQAEPERLLPPLAHPVEAVFDQRLRVIGADYPAQAASGGDYLASIGWQALQELPPETTVSLRLSQENTNIVAQLDDTLLSGWFPSETLPAGQVGLSFASIPIPAGTLPGAYRLQMVVYVSYKHPWPLAGGSSLLDLGEVEVVLPPAATGPVQVPSGYDFNGEIKLADYKYTAGRVGQGKGFGVQLLWQARRQPEDNYTLRVELVDRAGRVIRSSNGQPVNGRAPTGSWQAGQLVRDQVDLVLPASAPVGGQAVGVRLSWLRPDGSSLKVRRWGLPVADSLSLDRLEVVEKEGRVFDVPQVQYPVGVNLEDKARLIGYNSPGLQAGAAPVVRVRCGEEAAPCQVHFDFYWQGLGEMDQLYFVFLHLVDETGRIVAQHDLGPGTRGKEPTTSWLPGEVVLDPVDLALPAGLAPGRYTLRIGMYLPPDGPRLRVVTEAGQPDGDFIEIGAVQVLP